MAARNCCPCALGVGGKTFRRASRTDKGRRKQLSQQERDIAKDRLAQEAGYRLIRLQGTRDHDLTGAEIWSLLNVTLDQDEGR